MNHALIQLSNEPTGIAGFVIRLTFAVTAALLCALLASAFLQRMSAALRHRIWALGIVVTLLVPAMLLTSPGRRIGWIRYATNAIQPPERMVGAATLVVDTAPLNAEEKDGAAASLNREKTSCVPVSRPSGDGGAMQAVAYVTAVVARRFSATTWFYIAWSVPALLMLARLVGGAVASHAAVRRAKPISLSAADAAMLSEAALPKIFECDAIASPLCIGWFRSTILLPADWRSWPREQLRAVLTHELAHVARGDVLWQVIARFASAVYWPHPLVWYAARRMRIERELACDDWIVRRGESPTQYARWLLDLACELKAARQMGRLGVEMASRNGLQTRVQAVLDPARRRTPVSKRLSLLMTTLAVVLLILTGSLSPLRAVQTPVEKPTPARAPSAPTTAPAPEQVIVSDEGFPRYIAGRVVDEAGNGVGAARVTVVESRTVTADPDGRFLVMLKTARIPLLALRAESSDGQKQALQRLPFHRSMRQGDFQEILITVKPAVVHPITVTDAAGHPVADARISASFALMGSIQTTTDAEGKAALRLPANPSPMAMTAWKQDAGFDYVNFTRSSIVGEAAQVEIAPDFTGPTHFVLHAMKSIVIKAIDRKDRPLAGVEIRPLGFFVEGKRGALSRGIEGDSVETDATGTARVLVPADAARPVNISTTYGGYRQVGSATWDPKAGVDEVKVVLQADARYHMIVTGPDGKPVGGAEVLMVYDRGARNYGNFLNASVASDGIGDGLLLPDNYYMFTAMKGNLASEPVMKVVRSGDESVQIELKLKPAVRVHGRLTAGDPPMPVPNGTLPVQFDDGDSYNQLPPDQRLPADAVGPRAIHPAVMFNRRTDAQGNFEVFLLPGTYHLMDLSGDYTPGSPTRDKFVVPTDRADVTIDLHLKKALRVTAQ